MLKSTEVQIKRIAGAVVCNMDTIITRCVPWKSFIVQVHVPQYAYLSSDTLQNQQKYKCTTHILIYIHVCILFGKRTQDNTVRPLQFITDRSTPTQTAHHQNIPNQIDQ